jgi:hypothetical protein
MLRHGISFNKRLIRVRSLLINCDANGLCGYSAAAEGLRRSLGIQISAEEIFFKYHKKTASFPVPQDMWADDNFFLWVHKEFDIQIRFFRDVEGGSDLELFCFCGRNGKISCFDKHVDIYVHGGWVDGNWISYVHFHGIDPYFGTLIDESDQWSRQGQKRKQDHEIQSTFSLDFEVECLRLRGGGGGSNDDPDVTLAVSTDCSRQEIVAENLHKNVEAPQVLVLVLVSADRSVPTN